MKSVTNGTTLLNAAWRLPRESELRTTAHAEADALRQMTEALAALRTDAARVDFSAISLDAGTKAALMDEVELLREAAGSLKLLHHGIEDFQSALDTIEARVLSMPATADAVGATLRLSALTSESGDAAELGSRVEILSLLIPTSSPFLRLRLYGVAVANAAPATRGLASAN